MARGLITALAGWLCLVALGWWLAHARIDACDFRRACVDPATVLRDHTLLFGLAVPIVVFVVLVVIGAVRIERLNLRWPRRSPSSTRELEPVERTQDPST